MGQCGCGNYGGEFRLPGPGKDIYVIEFYGGCKDCDTPAGIVLYRMNEQEQAQWGALDLPELDMKNWDAGRLLPVMHLSDLQGRLQGYLETVVEEISSEEMTREAAFDTWSKWRKDALGIKS